MSNGIPRQAAFFWTGEGKVPWIRVVAARSFAAQHPGWKVTFYTDCEIEPSDAYEVRPVTKPDTASDELWGGAHPAAKSDIWRYWWLSTEGGVYVDTDMIFYGSLDPLISEFGSSGCECGITHDCGYNPRGRGRIALSIGLLASSPGGKFFSRLLERTTAMGTGATNDYQAVGVIPIYEMWGDLCKGIKVGNIPGALVYGKFAVGRRSRERELAMASVWGSGVSLSEGAIAIHWYGGSQYSANARADCLTPESFLDYADTPVGKAVALSLGVAL